MFSKITHKIKRWKWLQEQATSTALRDYFREKHRVDVGLYSYGCFDEWRMPGPISVGRYCSVARTVRSVPINHPYTAISTHPALYEKKFGVVERDLTWDDTLIIEDDVWIGHYAVILPNCKFIGRGAIIGAGAIVTKDVPAYTIVAGNPAKVLRKRFDEPVQKALEASGWWNMSLDQLRELIRETPATVFHPNYERLVELKNGRYKNV